MLNENIQALRKSKGLSQEELALKLNVVRQTVSKWERGLSVPDAEMLVAIAEVLDTPVSTLLGKTVPASEPEGIQALSEKLEVLNDQFARAQESKRRVLHALCIAIAAVTALVLLALAAIGARISNGISPIRNTRRPQRCSTGSNGSLCGSRPSSCSSPSQRLSPREGKHSTRIGPLPLFQATTRCSTSKARSRIITSKRQDKTPPPTPQSEEIRHDPA